MYDNAEKEYEDILKDPNVADFTTEEYGDLLHNIGVVKVHMTSFMEAAESFEEAYNLNHKEASITQYLLAILLSGNEELYNSEIEKYGLDSEFTGMLYEAIAKKEEEAKKQPFYKTIKSMEQTRKAGNTALYGEKRESILSALTGMYRKQIEG